MAQGRAINNSETTKQAYSNKVAQIRRSMSTQELAQIVSVQPRSVQHWAAGTNKPTGGARGRLLEVAYVVELLSDIYDDQGVEIWLHGRNKILGSRRPFDLLVDGDFDPVRRAAERLA